MASNRRVEMGAWLIVASDDVMTQQVPQIRNYWLLERQYIQIAYVEHSTVSLSHHGIFPCQNRVKIFTKMFCYAKSTCIHTYQLYVFGLCGAHNHLWSEMSSIRIST